METREKGRKRDRFRAWMKADHWIGQTGAQSASPHHSKETVRHTAPTIGDNERTRARYMEATKHLEKAVMQDTQKWGSFDFPELQGEPEDFNDSRFIDKINNIMEAQKNKVRDRGTWEKCRDALRCAFSAFSPFAKNFLTIASEISILNPYGLLCGGLLLLISIADKEVSRKAEFTETLDHMCRQLERLDIIVELPDDIPQHLHDAVINRVLDVRSACMVYLAINIHHFAIPLGTPGRVVTAFFLGDEEISDSKTHLRACVDEFGNIIADAHARVSFKTFNLIKAMAALSLRGQTQTDISAEEKFIVPYERNPAFLGRDKFLEGLRDALAADVPGKFSHRIALYGMGGIGKTQCALEYVYANRNLYERVYWIPATDQAALLSGYQKIATKAGLCVTNNANPADIAEFVLSWLRQRPSWLLVIDNLDDIKVAEGLLPENGAGKHTLITTRNPHTKGIPAEPLEVPVLGKNETIALLAKLSEIPIPPDSENEKTAYNIVEELGCLPLAIEQAAAFIREVTEDFTSYLDEYNRNRKKLNEWVSTGNRQYPKSIATTWCMSFQLLQQHHMYSANLLRLFAFLNPDGILIDFLMAGLEALEPGLQRVMSSQIEMATALLKLEDFSLIKWDRRNKMIIMHRLVQAVVIDEMSDEEATSIRNTIIKLFAKAFPSEVGLEALALRRKYQAQVIQPLLRMTSVRTPEIAALMFLVSKFLSGDGKYIDSMVLLQRAFDIQKETLGIENITTLDTMTQIALVYKVLGRFTEAETVGTSAFEMLKRVVGERQSQTLWAMCIVAEARLLRETNLDETVSTLEELYKISKEDYGDEDPLSLRIKLNLGRTYLRQGHATKASENLLEVLPKIERVFGEKSAAMLTAMSRLSIAYQMQGLRFKALELNRKAMLQTGKIFGDDHPDALDHLNTHSVLLFDMGRTEEAATLQINLLERTRRILGEEHPVTIAVMSNLSITRIKQGLADDAISLAERALEMARRVSDNVIQIMRTLARAYSHAGRTADAIKLQEEAVALAKARSGSSHPNTLETMLGLIVLYFQEGRVAEALPVGEETLEKSRRALGENHPTTAESKCKLALIYWKCGRTSEALEMAKDGLEWLRRVAGDEHQLTWVSRNDIYFMYRDLGMNEEADALENCLVEAKSDS